MQNKMVVNVLVRYQRALKYVVVYHDIFDIGMELSIDSYENNRGAALE